MNIEAGMAPEVARKKAMKTFGNAESLKEDCRDTWGSRLAQDVMRDLRLAWRQVRKYRGYSIIVVSILALCIGANTSIFSMLNNVILKPYPYPEAERLVRLGEVRAKTGSGNELYRISVKKYLEYKELQAFENIGLYRYGGDNLYFGDQAFRVTTGRVSPSFLKTLQVSPFLGRDFEEGEDGPGKSGVTILSYDLWRTAFDADVGVLGQRVDIEGMTFEVIGVMPEDFSFMDTEVSLWRPHIVSPADKTPERWNRNRLAAVARLKPGVSIQQAQAALGVLDNRIYEEYPERRSFIDRVGRKSRLAEFRSYVARNSTDILYLLQASVVVVFIIGCANIANLVFAKTTVRLREIAMHVSLGAGWGRIARMLLVEGLIYGFLAGLLGLALGLGGLELIKAYGLYSFPRPDSLDVDGVSLAYNFSLAIASGLVIGIAPLLVILGKNVSRLISESGRSTTFSKASVRTRHALAIGQVALTCVLLIATGLMLLSLKKILSNETGFEVENLVSGMLELPNASKPLEKLAYGDQLIQRLSEIPEVRSVALNTFVPFFGFFGMETDFHIEGHQYSLDNPHPTFSISFTQGPFFETVGIPLLQGRVFTKADMMLKAPSVVVIDKRLADLHFPGKNPIGKRLTAELNGDYSARADANWATVIGVVGSVKAFELDEGSEGSNPILYINAGAMPMQAQRIVMRVAGGDGFNLGEFKAKVRTAMSEVRATVPSTELQLISQRIDETLLGRRATLRFLAAFGGLALLLAAIGLYGILSYSVTLRRKELGIRTALGASRREILQMILVQGFRVTAFGLTAGLLVALVAMPLIEDRLYQTVPYDMGVYSGVVAVLAAVALCSSFIPALRAANANPVTALQFE